MAFFGILQRLAHPEGIYGFRETPQAIPFGPFVNQHHFAAFMEMTSGVARDANEALKRNHRIAQGTTSDNCAFTRYSARARPT